MIEVKLVLEHEGEIDLLKQFVFYLRAAREEWKKSGGFNEPSMPQSPAEAEAKAIVGAEPVITDADLEKAVTEYANKNGIPATAELLASFGVKRISELPSADRSRFFMRSMV
jgi:hypothetical protein